MRYELFSKRQKRIRGEVPDVYQYDIVPQTLRVQVVHIWRDVFGVIMYNVYGDPYRGAYEAYEKIHDILCREYGMFALDKDHQVEERVCNFFISTEETEKVIDVVELSFRHIDQEVRSNPDDYSHPLISPDDAIAQLNRRFHEHGVGYQYESGQIVKVDSQIIHSEVVKPTLGFLSDPIYEGANDEFLSAHEHYRERRYKECLNDCLKAFESCLKVICQKRGWNYSERDTANRLIAIVFDKGLIPPLMQSHFSALRSTLESGVPTIRNNQSGHGQGPEEIIVPEYIASYILHLTASNILLLAKADEEMK